MAQYTDLKTAINAAIKQNNNQEITGPILNGVLNAMVNSLGANYQLAGVATPSTNPGTPDQNVFYLAFEAGTYINFSSIELPAGISVLCWNGSWTGQTWYTIDDVPTVGSANLVKSRGIIDYCGLDVKSPEEFPYKRRHQVDTTTESATGNRYTIGIPVTIGTKIEIKKEDGLGLNVFVYANFNAACLGRGGTQLQTIASGYTIHSISTIITADGVLSIKQKKQDGSAITDSEVTQMMHFEKMSVITGLFAETEKLSVLYNRQVCTIGKLYIDKGNNKCFIDSNINGFGSSSNVYFRSKIDGSLKSVASDVDGYTFPISANSRSLRILCINDTEDGIEFRTLDKYNNNVVIAIFTVFDTGFYELVHSFIKVAETRRFTNWLGYLNMNNDKKIVELCIKSYNNIYISEVEGPNKTVAIRSNVTFEYPTNESLYVLAWNLKTLEIVMVKFSSLSSSGSYLMPLATLSFNSDSIGRVVWSSLRYKIDYDLAGQFLTDTNGCSLWFANSVKKVFIRSNYYRTSNDKLCFAGVFGKNGEDGLEYNMSSNHGVSYPETYYKNMLLCFDLDTNAIVWKEATAQVFLPILAAITFDVDNQKVLKVTSNIKTYIGYSTKNSFVFGELGNYAVTATDLNESTQRAGQLTVLALPHKGAKVRFNICDPDIVAAFRNGDVASNLNHNDYWYADGEEFTFSADSTFYRAIFAKTTNYTRNSYADIDPDEIMAMIAGGDIVIKYEVDDDVLGRNCCNESAVKASMLQLTSTLADNVPNKLPTFVHVTDVHGDIYRMNNALRYAEYLKADGILATGDIIARTSSNRFEALKQSMLESNVPVCFCRGNHETYNNSDSSYDVYGIYYEELAEEFGYLKVTDITDKTYYYKDFASRKIRVIALNPYEGALIRNNYGCFSQAQIDWFISTLISTPNDYGVICILHSPEAYPSTSVSIEKIEGKDDFFLQVGTPAYWSTPLGLSGTPLKDIVDAFISRTTINSSFTQTNDSSQSETITVVGDFSNVSASVEFIAWVCGHQHIDLIGQYKNTVNKQIVINSTCTICHYGSSSYPYLVNMSDIPRGDSGIVQDAINVITIDRTEKCIRIARVGSNMALNGVERQMLVLSYV